jgi:hypothetical protein
MAVAKAAKKATDKVVNCIVKFDSRRGALYEVLAVCEVPSFLQFSSKQSMLLSILQHLFRKTILYL